MIRGLVAQRGDPVFHAASAVSLCPLSLLSLRTAHTQHVLLCQHSLQLLQAPPFLKTALTYFQLGLWPLSFLWALNMRAQQISAQKFSS